MQGQIFEIRSAFSQLLCFNPEGVLISLPEETAEDKALLYIPFAQSRKGYIFSERSPGRKVRVGDIPFNNICIAVNLCLFKNCTYAFTPFGENLFLSVHAEEGWSFVRSSIIQKWEQFSLGSFSFHEIQNSEHILKFCRSIDCFFNHHMESPLEILIRDENFMRGLIANVTFLKKSEIDDISKSIVYDSSSIAILQNIWPDLWSSVALVELHKWLENRDNYIPLENFVGLEYDFIGYESVPPEGRGHRPTSPIEFFVFSARSQVKPRKKACVLATARNEGIYFPEWISYYKSIGFEGIFIYTNDCVDKTENLLSILDKQKIIHWKDSKCGANTNAQGKAYGYALGFSPEILDYEWVLVCDLDELFVFDLDVFPTLDNYISYIERKEVDSISFSWIHIGSSEQKTWDNRPFFQRFTNNGFHEDAKIKSMFRPQKAAKAYPHFPIEFDGNVIVRRNSTGNLMRTRVNEEKHGPHGKHIDDVPDNRFATIYHYYFKSVEEFLWKSSRNRGDHPKVDEIGMVAFDEEIAKWFIQDFEKNYPKDILPMLPNINRFSKNYFASYNNIFSIDGISEAYAQIVKSFSEKMETIYTYLSKKNEKNELKKYQKEVFEIYKNSK